MVATNKKKYKPYLHFFLHLCICMAALFSIDRIAGSILRYYYFNQHSGTTYRTTYSMELANDDVIVFGSSRATHHYKPDIFEQVLDMSCYNAGRDGQQVPYHFAVLQSVLKRYTPKIIVLDISFKDLLITDENYDWLSSLLPYYKSHPEIRPVVDLKSSFEKYKLGSATYPFNSMILTIFKNNSLASKIKEKKGYLPLDKEWKEPLTTDPPLRPDRIDSVKLRVFEKFMEDCKRAGAKLYVALSPVYIRYDEPHIALITIREACKRHAIPFYDYSTDTEFLANPALFHDRSHLNDKGATIYSEKIAKEIKKMLQTAQ